MTMSPKGNLAEVSKLSEVTRLLERAVRQLGAAGQADEASTIAAAAWAVVRDQLPEEATRLTGVLHLLNRPSAATSPVAPTVQHVAVQLDVRDEPPARRHELIFNAFHALEPGAGFVLVNDHDPKPLYYQFAAEYPDTFVWEPLEAGPKVWRVRIGNRIAATQPSDAIDVEDLESIATLVLEGLRVRGCERVDISDVAARAAWVRLQDTLRSGHVRQAELADLAQVLTGISVTGGGDHS